MMPASVYDEKRTSRYVQRLIRVALSRKWLERDESICSSQKGGPNPAA